MTTVLARPELGGLIVHSDALNGAELSALEARLRTPPGVEVLLIVGDRGLAGREEMLRLPGLRLLFEPVTLVGFERCLLQLPSDPSARRAPTPPITERSGEPISTTGSIASTESSIPASESTESPVREGPPDVHPCLSGLRAPLEQLLGTMQLLRSENREDERARILYALQSTAVEIERLIAALALATRPTLPKRSRVRVVEAARQSLRGLPIQDNPPRFEVDAERVAFVERDTLIASLYVAWVVLEHNGPLGPRCLSLLESPAGSELVWTATPSPAPGRGNPDLPEAASPGESASREVTSSEETAHSRPSWVEPVLLRLVPRLQARAVIELQRNPARVGLRWSRWPSAH